MKKFIDNGQEFKYCPSCKIIYPHPELMFNISKSRSDGLRCYCKECLADYRVEHNEEITKYQKTYNEKHKEKISIRNKKYNEEHKEERKERDEKNKDKILAYGEKYREEHREEARERNRKYRIEHPEDAKLRSKKYREEYPDKAKASERKYQRSEKGKINNERKNARRKRNLEFIPLFNNIFDESQEVEWHHIDNYHVVAIPMDVHRKHSGYNTKKHRRLLKSIVEEYYQITYLIIRDEE